MNSFETLAHWADRLGLNGWSIDLQFDTLDGEEAHVLKSTANRYAKIVVDHRVPDRLLDYTIVHELLHLVMSGTERWMKDDRSIRDMELADAELELTINTLSQALTGKAWYPWHPDDAIGGPVKCLQNWPFAIGKDHER